jgi:glutaminyl-tRNA synthetase
VEPKEDEDFTVALNPASLVRVTGKIEPSAAGAAPLTAFQFERVGYFCADRDSTPAKPVFNRTVQLKDTWAKIEKSQQKK